MKDLETMRNLYTLKFIADMHGMSVRDVREVFRRRGTQPYANADDVLVFRPADVLRIFGTAPDELDGDEVNDAGDELKAWLRECELAERELKKSANGGAA